MDSICLLRWFLKVAHADFKPHNALTITALLLAFLPISGPKMANTFSVTDACMYMFRMSANLTQDH